MDRRGLLVLAGGTQGEPGSAMARLAAGTHQDLSIDQGDTVILSSRAIPGNDLEVVRLTCDVLRRGARVHTRVTDPAVHTSGHATRDEQRRMIELIRPRCFLPVHGTLHHLRRHAELARDCGVKETLVVENGTAVLCDGGTVSAEGSVKSGVVKIGMGGAPLGASVLRDRHELGRSGIVTVAIARDRTGALTGPPSVAARGVPAIDEPHEHRALRGELARVAEIARKRRSSDDVLRDETRRAVRRFVADLTGERPLVDVHLLGEE